MKRLLTAGIFGTILGIVGAGTANASIVSSGFLDEKLTEYALSTSLDLKANQSDFTELNTQISDSIDRLKTFWGAPTIGDLIDRVDPNKFSNNIIGAFDLVAALFSQSVQSLIDGWTDSDYGKYYQGIKALNDGWPESADKYYQGIKALNDGWTSTDGTTYLGVKDLNTKIGTLPDGITLENFYSGWVISGGVSMTKEIAIQGGDGMVATYDPVRDDFGPQRFPGLGYLGVLAKLINGEGIGSIEDTTTLAPFWYLTKQAMKVGEIPHGQTAAGMIDEINTKIGTVPDGKNLAGMIGETDTKIGNLPESITVQGMLNGWTDGVYTFPGLAHLSGEEMKFTSTYGGSVSSILRYGLDNFTSQEYTGPLYPLWKLSQGIDQIGTLPTGNCPPFPGAELLFPGINQPHTYPTSLAELITAIYGDGEPGRVGLLAGIIAGVPVYDTDGNGSPDEYLGLLQNYNRAKTANDIANANAAKIGTVPDGKNLAGMISETDAKIGTVPDGKNLAGMIGTLPAGYDSVGAALSAIKGIAEEAKTAALAAIPDPKQEGSSGKYVLTVDIVGDNATYHWEKIDREGETTTTE